MGTKKCECKGWKEQERHGGFLYWLRPDSFISPNAVFVYCPFCGRKLRREKKNLSEYQKEVIKATHITEERRKELLSLGI
jgi:hypothetical protein